MPSAFCLLPADLNLKPQTLNLNACCLLSALCRISTTDLNPKPQTLNLSALCRISTAEASAAVMGVEYEKNKGSYVYGILTLKTGIDTFLLEQKELDWQSTMFLWLVGIIVMLLLGATQTGY